MTALIARFWPYITAGAAVLGLGATIAVLSAQKHTAIAERDLARVSLVGMTAALDAERMSTHAAVGAVERCAGEARESDARMTAALTAARSDADRARAQARACVSPAAVAERLGAAFR